MSSNLTSPTSQHFQFQSLLTRSAALFVACLATLTSSASLSAQDIVVKGKTIYTMAGNPIHDGVLVIRDGKFHQVGLASEIAIPNGVKVLEADVVTPGFIDCHSVVGLAGIWNQPHDQDQYENSSPIQPQLRATDAYNPHDPLVDWIRGFGVTTVHTGHAPLALMSGQTMIVKTSGNTVGATTIKPAWSVAATLGESAQASGGKSPGTRGKMMSMLRQKFIDAQAYREKRKPQKDKDGVEQPSTTPVNLELEAITDVLDGRLKLMVTADRAIDIHNALRLADEFQLSLVLDSAAEAYLMIDEIKKSGASVIVHPTMARATGDRENLSFQCASLLADAGIPIALQSGYEAYVPKTRVVLFEAGVAASHGLGPERALSAITIDAAKLLGIEKRVGSIEVQKDADCALFDGDPLEYTTHCLAVVIDGAIVSEQAQ